MDKNRDDYLNLNINYNKTEYNEVPKLIAPNVNFFFKNILRNCNKIKNNNYNLSFNIGLLILFLFILITILCIKYKGGNNSMQQYKKNIKDKEYIMSKLIYYNKTNIENNQRMKNNMITNLPDHSNHPEAELLHKKIYF